MPRDQRSSVVAQGAFITKSGVPHRERASCPLGSLGSPGTLFRSRVSGSGAAGSSARCSRNITPDCSGGIDPINRRTRSVGARRAPDRVTLSGAATTRCPVIMPVVARTEFDVDWQYAQHLSSPGAAFPRPTRGCFDQHHARLCSMYRARDMAGLRCSGLRDPGRHSHRARDVAALITVWPRKSGLDCL